MTKKYTQEMALTTIKIDQLAFEAIYKRIDDFIDSCMDDNGKVKVPDRKELFKLRQILPGGYRNSFQK